MSMQYMQHLENARANRNKERETHRSNLAQEDLKRADIESAMQRNRESIRSNQDIAAANRAATEKIERRKDETNRVLTREKLVQERSENQKDRTQKYNLANQQMDQADLERRVKERANELKELEVRGKFTNERGKLNLEAAKQLWNKTIEEAKYLTDIDKFNNEQALELYKTNQQLLVRLAEMFWPY